MSTGVEKLSPRPAVDSPLHGAAGLRPYSVLGAGYSVLHAWAVFAAVVALVLTMMMGANVTTFHVGMADPVWPTGPLYLFLTSWTGLSKGFLIEHGHRLFGYAIGLCTIILAVGLWMCDPRPRMRWLGVVALAGVIVQGVLGGLRVKLHEVAGPELAMVHGCVGPCFFALLVSIALFTSRGWTVAVQDETEAGGTMGRWSVLTAGLIFLQLFLGATVRHTYSRAGQRGHLLVAFAVVAAVVWLLKLVAERPAGARLRRTVWFLAALVVVQLLLGVEAWVIQFGSGVLPELQTVTVRQGMLRTGHALVGYLIFGSAVAAALEANQAAVSRWLGSFRPEPGANVS